MSIGPPSQGMIAAAIGLTSPPVSIGIRQGQPGHSPRRRLPLTGTAPKGRTHANTAAPGRPSQLTEHSLTNVVAAAREVARRVQAVVTDRGRQSLPVSVPTSVGVSPIGSNSSIVIGSFGIAPNRRRRKPIKTVTRGSMRTTGGKTNRATEDKIVAKGNENAGFRARGSSRTLVRLPPAGLHGGV